MVAKLTAAIFWVSCFPAAMLCQADRLLGHTHRQRTAAPIAEEGEAEALRHESTAAAAWSAPCSDGNPAVVCRSVTIGWWITALALPVATTIIGLFLPISGEVALGSSLSLAALLPMLLGSGYCAAAAHAAVMSQPAFIDCGAAPRPGSPVVFGPGDPAHRAGRGCNAMIIDVSRLAAVAVQVLLLVLFAVPCGPSTPLRSWGGHMGVDVGVRWGGIGVASAATLVALGFYRRFRPGGTSVGLGVIVAARLVIAVLTIPVCFVLISSLFCDGGRTPGSDGQYALCLGDGKSAWEHAALGGGREGTCIWSATASIGRVLSLWALAALFAAQAADLYWPVQDSPVSHQAARLPQDEDEEGGHQPAHDRDSPVVMEMMVCDARRASRYIVSEPEGRIGLHPVVLRRAANTEAAVTMGDVLERFTIPTASVGLAVLRVDASAPTMHFVASLWCVAAALVMAINAVTALCLRGRSQSRQPLRMVAAGVVRGFAAFALIVGSAGIYLGSPTKESAHVLPRITSNISATRLAIIVGGLIVGALAVAIVVLVVMFRCCDRTATDGSHEGLLTHSAHGHSKQALPPGASNSTKPQAEPTTVAAGAESTAADTRGTTAPRVEAPDVADDLVAQWGLPLADDGADSRAASEQAETESLALSDAFGERRGSDRSPRGRSSASAASAKTTRQSQSPGSSPRGLLGKTFQLKPPGGAKSQQPPKHQQPPPASAGPGGTESFTETDGREPFGSHMGAPIDPNASPQECSERIGDATADGTSGSPTIMTQTKQGIYPSATGSVGVPAPASPKPSAVLLPVPPPVPKPDPAKVDAIGGAFSAGDDENAALYRPGGYHPVLAGEMFNGRYQALCKLGWGEYSIVWLARDTSVASADAPGAFVALKIAKSADTYCRAANAERVTLTRIEQRMTQPKVDPIVSSALARMSDAFEHRGPHGTHVVVAMELAGPNLLSLISAHNFAGVHLSIVKAVVARILDGLIALHEEAHVVHTDLKPENVLFASPGHESMGVLRRHGCSRFTPALEERTRAALKGAIRPRPCPAELLAMYDTKVADLGTARLRAVTAEGKLSGLSAPQTAASGGGALDLRPRADVVSTVQTREYRAPEIVLGFPDASIGPPMDIWSVACMTFELLTGCFLFDPKCWEGNDAFKARKLTFDMDSMHVALFMQMLGPIPDEVLTKGVRTKRFFRASGRSVLSSVCNMGEDQSAFSFTGIRIKERLLTPHLRRFADRLPQPLDEEDITELSEFMSTALVFDPEKRGTAKELRSHRWLSGY